MNSPAYGLLWYVVRRNRIGLCIVGPLIVLAGVSLALAGSSAPIEAHLVGAAICTWSAIYLLGVLANAEGDLVSAGTGYPKPLLVLPVSTASLVFWPMVLGCVAGGLSGALSAFCFTRHDELRSLWGPALGLATIAACLQAAVWHPYKMPNFRGVAVIMAVAIPPLIAGIAWLNEVPPAGIAGIFLAIIAGAGVMAYSGVATARRGDVGEGSWTLPAIEAARSRAAKSAPFSSAMQAQVWLEWRRNGRMLPLMTAATCAMFGVILVLARNTSQPIGIGEIMGSAATLAGLIVFPLAVIGGGAVGCCCHRSETLRRDLTAQPFHATRPLTSAQMVGAKLQMAVLSALASGGVLLVYLAAWLLQPAQESGRSAPLGLLLLHHATPRMAPLFIGAFICLIAAVWVAEVSSLSIEVCGREWLYNLFSVLLSLIPSGTLAGLVILLYRHPARIAPLTHALPYLLAAGLVVKAVIAVFAYRALAGKRLVPSATLRNAALVWIPVACLMIALVVSIAPPGIAPLKSVIPVVILALPVSRLLAAPLALNWNRHR